MLAASAVLLLWDTNAGSAILQSDVEWYRLLALGQKSVVMRPFADRVLAPALVRGFSHVSGISIDSGFLLLGIANCWIFLCIVLQPLLRNINTWLLAASVLLLPFWSTVFNDYYLPDLMHAALLAIYFFLLRRRNWAASAALLFLLFTARESTMLLAVIAVPVLWRTIGRKTGMMHLLAAAAGMVVSSMAGRGGLPNAHGLNGPLYLLGKVPWNLSQNVLGIFLWSNTEPVHTPTHIFYLPHWLHLGGIHAIGFGAMNSQLPLINMLFLMTAFGLAPCILLLLTRRSSLRSLFPRDEPFLSICLLYGAASFLMTPALGTGVSRLAGYAWPLFFIYLPEMLARHWRWRPTPAIVILLLHLAVAWIVPLYVLTAKMSVQLALCIVLALYALAAALLWRQLWQPTDNPLHTAPESG